MESGGLLEQEDVGANECTRGTEIYDSCESDCTLVTATAIDGNPDDGYRHCEIATARDEEHSHVSHFRVWRVSDLDGEAGCEDGEAQDVEIVATVQPSTHVCENNRENGSDKVYGDSVDLGLGCSVTETFKNGRLEVRKRICVLGNTHVHDNTGHHVSVLSKDEGLRACSPSPDFPVLEVAKRLLDGYVLLGDMIAVSLDAGEHEIFVFWRQKGALLGERRDCRPTRYAD